MQVIFTFALAKVSDVSEAFILVQFLSQNIAKHSYFD